MVTSSLVYIQEVCVQERIVIASSSEENYDVVVETASKQFGAQPL